jgi:hypothetical protein
MQDTPESATEYQTVNLDRETTDAIADMLNLLADALDAPSYQCSPDKITSSDVKKVVGLAMFGFQTRTNSGFCRS